MFCVVICYLLAGVLSFGVHDPLFDEVCCHAMFFALICV